MKIIKKYQKKFHYFPKMLGILVFIQNEMECERCKQDFSNKVIVLNATCVIIFQYKNVRKTSFKKYYYTILWSISITTKANLRRICC